MWLCIQFPVRHQFINLIKEGLLSIKKSISYQKKLKKFRYNFFSIFLNEVNDVANIYIVTYIIPNMDTNQQVSVSVCMLRNSRAEFVLVSSIVIMHRSILIN